jgi:hypothetical protein
VVATPAPALRIMPLTLPNRQLRMSILMATIMSTIITTTTIRMSMVIIITIMEIMRIRIIMTMHMTTAIRTAYSWK